MTVEKTHRELAAVQDMFPKLALVKQEITEHYKTLTRQLEGSSSQDAHDGVAQLFQAEAAMERADAMLRHARQRVSDYSAFL